MQQEPCEIRFLTVIPLACPRRSGSGEWREMESGGKRRNRERGGNPLYPYLPPPPPHPLAVFPVHSSLRSTHYLNAPQIYSPGSCPKNAMEDRL